MATRERLIERLGNAEVFVGHNRDRISRQEERLRALRRDGGDCGAAEAVLLALNQTLAITQTFRDDALHDVEAAMNGLTWEASSPRLRRHHVV